MSEFLNTDSDDVIQIPGMDRGDLAFTEMFEVSQLWKKMKDRWDSQSHPWFEDGKPGRLLKTSGGGWHKGRFRIRLEFIPDDSDSDSDNLP